VGALMNEPSEFRAQLSNVFEELNDLLVYAHEQIQSVFGDSEPETITVGNLACRRYEGDGELNHWRAEICRIDGGRREYSWEVQGRPLASTSDGDYQTVFIALGCWVIASAPASWVGTWTT
jgi:hypothetical protein